MKPGIHFHSDCPFFAGCENLLANLFQDDRFMESHGVSFSYRHSHTYESGFRRRVTKQFNVIPLKLFDVSSISTYANSLSFRPGRIMIKAAAVLLLVKYWFLLWNALVLWRVFSRERIDLLHINNGGYPGALSCTSAVLAAQFCGIRRIVYSVNNIAVPYTSVQRWLDLPWDRVVANSVSRFVTGSVYAKQKLADVLRLAPSAVTHIPNGIEPREITEDKPAVLRRLGIDEKRFLIGVVAVLEERKGHACLFKALKQLKGESQTRTLPLVLCAGTGRERQSLVNDVESLSLQDNVRFVGEENNVINLMSAVDAIVLPSISHEDFPYVVLEGMSLGKPIIASKISGIPEQIEDMESGILVEPKDVNGLAKAIRSLIENPSLCARLGGNAQRRFNQRFLATFAVDKYMALYSHLLSS